MPTTEKKARGPRGRYNQHFRWTEDRINELATAYYLTGSPDETIAAKAKRIAQAKGWPQRSVQNKLYEFRKEDVQEAKDWEAWKAAGNTVVEA